MLCKGERVEDRIGAGLYLEMTDRAIDKYEVERVPEVLRYDGVVGATWWANTQRDRQDLPRVLAEFSHLGVYETDSAFQPPNELPSDIVGHHFIATGRPGQGILSGRPTIGLSLVLISPGVESREQELRDWADFVHIRHIAEAAVPGYTMITPYVNARNGGHPRFMHFYEMDCEDPERAFKAMTPLVTNRIGGPDTERWRDWAHGPSLRIMYVNTFVRIGTVAR